ncbi:MAG: glycosyltransferase [Phycisphaerae bacterium]|nr:glycosyltransferase [Phycisphaerae bacterium]NUQ46703.1 glycosyltransferase [Phycisphaerae bacterium]
MSFQAPQDGAAKTVAARHVGVDIVVPVYNARADVERCVDAVSRHARGDWRLVLVDDASTDPQLTAMLDRLPTEQPRILLLRNEFNSGFVVSANRGMKQADGRDVVLLNSDTAVTAGFVEKLIACAYAEIACGIVSPLTNNGTICSVPEWCRYNEPPADFTLDEYGAMIERVSLRRRPEMVTAVGFCMYIRADVLRAVGYFDEANYGRGFGEENDLCQRARRAGYRVRLCDDLFVFHAGSASFNDEARVLEQAHAEVLERLNPGYHAAVHEFIRTNPLGDIQDNVRLQLRRGRGGDRAAVMYVLHVSPYRAGIGGTEYHARDKIAAMKHPRCVLAYPADGTIEVAEVFDGRVDEPLRYRFPLASPPRRDVLRDATIETLFASLLETFSIGCVHFEHMQTWPLGLWRVCHQRGMPYLFTTHDYSCVCPNVNLIHHGSMTRCACDPADVDATRSCLKAYEVFAESSLGDDPAEFLRRWRVEFRELLTHARHIVFPSAAARDLIRRYDDLPSDSGIVLSHGYESVTGNGVAFQPARQPLGDDVLRIGVVGATAYPPKGAGEVVKLMRGCRDRPIEWHVFGPADAWGFADQLRQAGLGRRLVLHGSYARETIQARLREARIDLAVLFPLWPETFCYVLSELLGAGVPVLAYPAGAIAERVRASGAGVLVDDVTAARAALEALLSDRSKLATLQEAARRHRHKTLAENAAEYDGLYRACFDPDAPGAAPAGPAAYLMMLQAARRVEQRPPAPAVIEQPSRYQARRWYPLYRALKPLIPAAARFWARRAFSGRRVRWYRRYDLSQMNGTWTPNEQMAAVAGTRRCRALRFDPRMECAGCLIPTQRAHVMRLVMRCWSDRPVFARLLWSHDAADAFGDERSIWIPLAADGVWNEYWLDLRDSDKAPAWTAAAHVNRLRLEPVNEVCEFELRDLSFGEYF